MSDTTKFCIVFTVIIAIGWIASSIISAAC